MSSVKAILRIDKINAKGLAPLYLRSTHNRKSAFKALGIYIHPDDWDAVAEKVRKSKRVPNSIRINNLIAAQKLEVQNYLLDVAGGAKPYNPQAVKRAVSRFNHASFTQYAEDYLKSIHTAEKYTTYKTYRTLLRNLNEYAGRELYFGDIDVTFLKDYYRYMTVTKGNTNNTALSNLKLIRKLFYDAIREEIVQPDQNPFPKFKFKWDTPDVEYLTEEELERIETLSYPEGSLIGHVRDLYVFVCYAAGIRIGDALRLKWGNVEGERLSLTTEKTKSGLNILLPSKAQAILQRYKMPDNKPSDYVFPFIRTADTGIELRKEIERRTAYINRLLKKIAAQAGIDKNIHFHTSRHTFAVRSVRRKMGLYQLSRILTHNSLKTTQIYLNIANEDLDKAMSEAFD